MEKLNRDPETVIKEIKRLASADIRVGQIFYIVNVALRNDGIDIFNVENDELVKYMKQIANGVVDEDCIERL